MGMCLNIYVQQKSNNKLYNTSTELDINEIELIFCNNTYNLEKVFCGDGKWYLLSIIKEASNVIIDDEDDGQIFAYIDETNIDTAIFKIKEKIDYIIIGLGKHLGKYKKESYGDNSELYSYCELLDVIEKFKNNNNNNLTKEYLFICGNMMLTFSEYSHGLCTACHIKNTGLRDDGTVVKY